MNREARKSSEVFFSPFFSSFQSSELSIFPFVGSIPGVLSVGLYYDGVPADETITDPNPTALKP
ncbi:hypothetical protein HPP92_022927 [Vanilla planifolia]|uniref:Uncharacterized protein n=1 Tax=Vanilla planifolia TaxID=51239 RepID=A0A835PU65_VANPL|nr:hypothetical protein HPP92_022927 [Vanilla planifolia]